MSLILVACCLAFVLIPACSCFSQTLSVTLNTNSWEIGSLPLGAVQTSVVGSNGSFCVSNSGTLAAEIRISVSNSIPSGWMAASVAGTNSFRMNYATRLGQSVPLYREVKPTGSVMTNSLFAGQIIPFDLQFHAPKPAETNVMNRITITITAIEAE